MAERRTIVIDPVTRIEGHSKITLHLNEEGKVEDARFHVTQFRGFEKFCEGRPFAEMPSLMARICGICPVSHLIASAKACDGLLAVRIPPTADKLRRIFGIAQVVQSHALSLFHLSSPDLLLGMDADPAESNLFGVLAEESGAGTRWNRTEEIRAADHRAPGRQTHSPRLGGAGRRKQSAQCGRSRRHPQDRPRSIGHRGAQPGLAEEHDRAIP